MGRLKINETPGLLKALTDAIETTLTEHRFTPQEIWKDYKNRDLSRERFHWDIFYASRPHLAPERKEEFRTLDNNHISSALNRAMTDLGFGPNGFGMDN